MVNLTDVCIDLEFSKDPPFHKAKIAMQKIAIGATCYICGVSTLMFTIWILI